MSTDSPAQTPPNNAADDASQLALFDLPPDWTQLWKGMPEFKQDDQTPYQSLTVHFKDHLDRAAFAKLIGQTITDDTRSLWFPKAEIRRYINKRFVTKQRVLPKYPIYVPTKGRHESALTIKALERMGIPYFAVIQPQELELYSPVVRTGKILLLPPGLDGLVPARNWIKDHSVAAGDARHWQIDDNIDGFYRLFDNLKTPVLTGACFRAMEDFSDRYTNVAISGPNYFMFASRKTVMPPYTLNTRIYSCSLVNNSIPHRWRDVYNDDTDICIRALKDGFATVLFNAFLCLKAQTMTIAGGNTPIYQGDGRWKMAESLRLQHPDIVTVTEKWGRYQHHVDYRGFKANALIARPEIQVSDAVNDYGMRLEEISDEERAIEAQKAAAAKPRDDDEDVE